MAKSIIYTKKAPAPIGPYSQGVRINDMVFLSGQIALHAETGELVMSNIEEETKQVMANILVLLEEVGLDFSAIIKTSIFLKDMNDFARVNTVCATYFSADFPARETVQVSRLPKDVNVEISVVASF